MFRHNFTVKVNNPTRLWVLSTHAYAFSCKQGVTNNRQTKKTLLSESTRVFERNAFELSYNKNRVY
jgi:hypothetical protein